MPDKNDWEITNPKDLDELLDIVDREHSYDSWDRKSIGRHQNDRLMQHIVVKNGDPDITRALRRKAYAKLREEQKEAKRKEAIAAEQQKKIILDAENAAFVKEHIAGFKQGKGIVRPAAIN